MKAAEEAQEKLANFRKVAAIRVALDAILPGWVYVDASDHLPREKWNAFVSNDPDEWTAWLIEQGVPADKATSLVKFTFDRRDRQG